MNHFWDNNVTVFKFGGASVKDAAGVRNLHSILERHQGKTLFVVISAMGKTTNLLEKILPAYFYQKESPTPLFSQLKENHLKIVNELDVPQQELAEGAVAPVLGMVAAKFAAKMAVAAAPLIADETVFIMTQVMANSGYMPV